jgi:predicted nucleotidyltransferase
MLSIESKQFINDVLKRYFGEHLLAVYLFGSLASGEQTTQSDIDVAFLMKEMPEVKDVFDAKTELSYHFRRDVDLIDLWRADTVTKAQVVTTGELLFAFDRYKIDEFEMIVLSQYALLNEERAGIISDIAQRGSVYG